MTIKSQPNQNLHDIEKTFYTLLMNKEAREGYIQECKSKNGATADVQHKGRSSKSDEARIAFSPSGIALYASLLNYGHHDVINSIYPGCRKVLDDAWESIVDDYLLKYPPKHHTVNRLADSLSDYFTKYGGTYLKKYPFLSELAHYEWIELELMENPQQIFSGDYEGLTQAEHFTDFGPIVNPVLIICDYEYPIADICDLLSEDRPLKKSYKKASTSVAICRNPETHLCRFLELGSISSLMLKYAITESKISPYDGKKNSFVQVSYKELLEKITANANGISLEDCVLEYMQLVDTLQELGMFCGSAPIANS
jgi:hypothetical protein